VGWTCGTNGVKKRTAYKLLVGKLEESRSEGRPAHVRMDNIQMDLVETGWGNWHGLVVSSREVGNEPSGSIKC
jgi:hypothetical protein